MEETRGRRTCSASSFSEWESVEPGRGLVRRGQHSLLVAAPPRPHDPLALAWLGVLYASVLLVVVLPLQLVRVGVGPITSFMWLPMLVFEVVLALWLIIKGVEMPVRMRSA